jgi:hypothetical protein
MSKLVTIRTFHSNSDLELVKMYLESLDIACFTQDEIFNRLYVPSAIGGAKLKVREEDVEQAVAYLMEGGYLSPEDLEPSAGIKFVDKFLDKFRKKS